MYQEIEIRFDVRPDDLTRLARTPAPGGIAAGPPATRHLSSVYYDTPDLLFAKAGLALRVRKSGRNYVQTVKNQGTGPLNATRGEYECSLPSASPDLRFVPDPDLREKLTAIADGEGFEPVIETEIRRTTRALKTETGDEIELALDRGEIRTLRNGRAVMPVSEIELELKHGSPTALYDVARLIARETPLTIKIESKAERGLRALEGKTAGTRKAGRMELPSDATAEEAFRATLSHCLRHIARNTSAVTEARDPEGIHQIRVGLRRLRVALSVLGDAFRVGPFEDLRARAKKLAEALAATREFDVFATELLAPVEVLSKKGDLAPLHEALDDLRKTSWEDAVALVRSSEFTGFLLDLAAAIETRAWREAATPERLSEFLHPARGLAPDALDKRLKQTKKCARHLSELDITERHRLRISLKKLRYTAEFFAPLFDAGSVAEFLTRLSRLQDLFGALNDAAMAEHILDGIVRHGAKPGSVSLPEAAAFIEGWHQSRIPLTWEKAKKRWRRFAKTEPFWARS